MSSFRPYSMVPVKRPWMPTIQEHSEGRQEPVLTIGMLAPLFLEWARLEMRRSRWTIVRYEEALRWVIRHIGERLAFARSVNQFFHRNDLSFHRERSKPLSFSLWEQSGNKRPLTQLRLPISPAHVS